MIKQRRTVAVAGGVGAVLAVVAGCTIKEDRGKLDLGVAPISSALADSAAYKDTVASVAYLDGLGPMRVQGYGLVVGLGKNGSQECPRSVRDQLIRTMLKMERSSGGPIDVRKITPEKLIGDLDTAPVLVRAEVPGGASEGTRFDVSVSVISGTQTKSLRGGRLYTAELAIHRETPAGTSISGDTVAMASGPLMINPFADSRSATNVTELEGTIVGGGVALKPRTLRLVLMQPSHATARLIQERINNHFSSSGRVADAVSPGFVDLRVPPRFRDDTGHFLSLVRALYLRNDATFEATRVRQLAAEIIRPTAPHAMISACFEALGRSALAVLPDLYTHEQDYVSFHAAAAGIRLGDHIAVDAMAMHTRNAKSLYRFQAIRALGDARGMANAAHALQGLLADEDPRVAIVAYEALLNRKDAMIASAAVGGDGFLLDIVSVDRPNMIYVKRTGERRIALFGQGLRCSTPAHYASPDGSFTLNAYADDEQLTLFRVSRNSERTSPSVAVSGELTRLIRLMGNEADEDIDGRVTGLGLDYGAVLRAIQHLCQEEAINAKFVLEQPNMAELFGPGRPRGRPESELGAVASAPDSVESDEFRNPTNGK